MPIGLTPFSHDPRCWGQSWTVSNEDELAVQIGMVALGYARHVKKILHGIAAVGDLPEHLATEGAIRLLTADDEDAAYHRDGWMFQVMSWIAAAKANPGELIRPPHNIRAHKGFDGLQLKVDTSTGAVLEAIIFEDKATDNPRDTIRDKVWPELAEFETGLRDNELNAEVVALLETSPTVDADLAIKNIIWGERRSYRVSITIGDVHNNANTQWGNLFKGYDEVVQGDLGRRTGNVFYVDSLREWMAKVADKAIEWIQTRNGAHV